MTNENQVRKSFIEGTVDVLRLGGYGGTVKIERTGVAVRITVTKPKRRQRSYSPDHRAVREEVVKAAEMLLATTRGNARTPRTPSAPAGRTGGVLLTPRMVWMAYVESCVGTTSEDVLRWGRKEIDAFLRSLTPEARQQASSADSIAAVLLAARRLHDTGAVPLDADLDTISAGHLNLWVSQRLGEGMSPHTVSTYLRRFSSAVRSYRTNWPAAWAGRVDPTEGLRRIRVAHIKPPELTEEDASKINAALMEMGEWRALAAAVIAQDTGRRIGSIAGGRDGLHIDALPLCANDIGVDGGRTTLTFRAAAQKGESYGRGDNVMYATLRLQELLGWLAAKHPNPAGPMYPLIWDEADPTSPARYHRLRSAFDRAWTLAIGGRRPRNLLWHSICRGTITTIADAAGINAAAEFSGRTADTTSRIYKRTRPAQMVNVVDHLDGIRSLPW